VDGTWFLVFKVLASLVLVLGAFLVLVWYLKGVTRTSAGAGEGLRLRGRLAVAPGAELLLVEAAGRLYLLGWSPKGFDVIDGLGEEALELLDQASAARSDGESHGVDEAVISQLLRLDQLRRVRTGEP